MAPYAIALPRKGGGDFKEGEGVLRGRQIEDGLVDRFSLIVIPAKAGIHPSATPAAAMDSRFRGNDGKGAER